MFHQKTVPPMRTLKYLSEICGPFPIKNYQLQLAAERFGFNGRVMELLRRFPAGQVFHSRDSFLEHCKELETLLRSEREAARGSPIGQKGVHDGYYPADTADQTRIKNSWRNFFRTS